MSLVSITAGFIGLFGYIISVLAMSRDREIYEDKLYIFSENYIVETITGIEEVEDSEKEYIRRENLEDIKIEDSKVKIEGNKRRINISNADEIFEEVQEKIGLLTI